MLLCVIFVFCNTDSFFLIPRPLAYYVPNISASFTSPDATPERRRARPRRPLVTEGDFKALKLANAAYAMDQVLPLPLETAGVIRSLFYPAKARGAPLPTLCRLYFGKVIVESSNRPIVFFNSANFPLDLARYNQMRSSLPNADLPSPEEISYGMGQMLGRLHWRAGYDGRDIEFVLGGVSFSGVESYVIDFNQMRVWERKQEDIPKLVESFFVNDPYYPRPRADDGLYQRFCDGYRSVCRSDPESTMEIAEKFLHAIEVEQAKRDANKTRT